jgi:hypothetical protein
VIKFRGNLKKVCVVSAFIKKYKSFSTFLSFFRISQNYFFTGKIMDRVYGSRDHGWLSVHGGLMTMGRCGRSGAREVVVIARGEGGGLQGYEQWHHLEAE